MSGQNLNLKIRITGDGSDLKAEVVGVESSIKDFGQQAEKSAARADKAFTKTRKGVESISRQLGRLQRLGTSAFAFVGIQAGVRGLIHMSDTYTGLNAQLATATSNTRELRIAQTELARIARETRGSWEATVTVYARMARATKELGIPQRDLLTVTKALNHAVVVSGATSTEASNALIQLSQGMASGTLRGDELRSVLEQIPRVGQAIAKGMGISFGQLRQLGQEGKITTQQIITALKKQSGVLQEEFNKMPPTVASASQQVSDSMTRLWGEFTTTSGAATGLANSILFVADNLRSVATGALVAAKLAAIGFAGKLALVSVEANTATLATLGLNRATLGLYMLYKSGGISAVLSAPFIRMRGATKAAFKGIGALRIASSALFAAYTGWEIGSYLSDQFAIVRQAGVALVAGLVRGWTYIKSSFELMGAGISIAWDNMIAGLKHALGSFLAFTGRAIDKLPFMDGVAASVKGYATQLQHAQGPLETFAAAQKRINDERDRTISQQDKILAAMFVDAGKNNTSPGVAPKPHQQTQSFIPQGNSKELKKLLSSASSLTEQLQGRYKTAFERISDRYYKMFDKLVAIGKPGERRLEELTTAYGQFAERYWQKQEEKRKSILQRGVDTIAESLLSENERRKQALDNRLAMVQQALDDGLLSEQRALELRNQLHADYDQRLADQKLQAMQDAEQNANDLRAQFAQIASSNQLTNLESLRSNISQHLDLISQKNEKTGKKELSFTKATAAQKLAFVSGSLKMLGGLMQSHNRKAFELGKAAAIADATVSTIVAVMKAWKDYGWPVGAALGVGIAAAGAINVAKIASTKMGGASAGGIAGGNASAPSVTGGASNVVPLNPNTGIPQQQSAPPVAEFRLTVEGDPSKMTDESKRLLADEMTTRIAQNLANGHGGGLRAAA